MQNQLIEYEISFAPNRGSEAIREIVRGHDIEVRTDGGIVVKINADDSEDICVFQTFKKPLWVRIKGVVTEQEESPKPAKPKPKPRAG